MRILATGAGTMFGADVPSAVRERADGVTFWEPARSGAYRDYYRSQYRRALGT